MISTFKTECRVKPGFKRSTWLLVRIAAAFFLLAACKSNSGSKKSGKVFYPETLTEVKTQTGVGQTTAKYTFHYDGQHRIISKTANFDPGMRSEYAYTDGGYTESLYVNDSLATQNTYTLNNLSLVDSLMQIDVPDHDTLSARFVYDDNKQLITQRQYFYTADYGFLLYNSIAYTYDSSNNLLSMADGYRTTTYMYSTTNFNSLSLGQIYMSQMPLLPDVENSTQPTGEMSSTGHIYTYDAEGRLMIDAASRSDGTTISRTYTY